MSLAFRFGRARVVRRSSKNMPALHASAIQLPGPGACWVHWCGQLSPEGGRQRQISVTLVGKKKNTTKNQGQEGSLAGSSTHPSIHSTNIYQSWIWCKALSEGAESGRGPIRAWTIQKGSGGESKSSEMGGNEPGKPGQEDSSKQKGTGHNALSWYFKKTCKQVNASPGWPEMGRAWAGQPG